ncbi:MAG TPA: hypothetical protein VNK50_13045 [Calidithermus sp.]|nr:hypothetical protein [Calidithermus sp.]
MLELLRLQAAIVGNQVTLTKEPGGSGRAMPPHLDVSQVVITTAAATAPAEFWQAAATGRRYRLVLMPES